MSQGDDLLKRRALESGLVTPPAMTKAEQESPTRPLAEILVQRGLLTEDQIKRLSAPSEDDPAPADVEHARKNPEHLIGVDQMGRPRYILVSEIGRGGMGIVWRAWEPGLERYVALKFLTGAEPEDAKRFQREAQVAAKLSHPNIAPVYAVDRDRGRWYIAMQLIAGQPLDHFRFKPRESCRIIQEAARAIDAANAAGIIHRDIKPQNIMLSAEGRPYVMDFGLAKPLQSNAILSLSGTVVGTPAYMAPEQARGARHIDARADVYGLGATLYHLVTGRAPFGPGDPLTVLRDVLEKDPMSPSRLVSHLPRDLETIICTCLEKDPARRYATAGALAEDLRRFLNHDPIRARPTSTFGRLVRRMHKHRTVIGGISALVLLSLVAIITSWLLKRSSEERLGAEAKEAREQAQRTRNREQQIVDARPILESARKKIVAIAELAMTTNGTRPALASQAKRALEDLDLAERTCPGLAETCHLRGRTHHLSHDYEKAFDAYGAAVELAPNDPTIRIDRARLSLYYYLNLRGEPDLVSVGLPAIGYPPDPPQAQIYKSTALEDLAIVDRYGREPRDLHVGRALVAFLEHRYEDAVRDMRASFELFPIDAEAHFICGRALLYLGRSQETIEEATLALKYRPLYTQVYGDRATAYAQAKQYDKAIEDAEIMAKYMPERAEPYTIQGTIFSAQGKFPEAIERFSEAISKQEGNRAPAYLNRANAYSDLGKPDPTTGLCDVEKLHQALTDFDRAIDLRPTAIAHYNRGQTLAWMGKIKEAIEDFTRSLAIDPNFLPAIGNRCYAYMLEGELEAALADSKRLIDVAPSLGRAWGQRGDVLSRLNRKHEALECWKKALELDPAAADYLKPLIEKAQRQP